MKKNRIWASWVFLIVLPAFVVITLFELKLHRVHPPGISIPSPIASSIARDQSDTLEPPTKNGNIMVDSFTSTDTRKIGKWLVTRQPEAAAYWDNDRLLYIAGDPSTPRCSGYGATAEKAIQKAENECHEYYKKLKELQSKGWE